MAIDEGIIGKGLRFIFAIYMIVATTIFIPYFNWQFAQENGFVKWLLLGEIVPTFKGLAWPYFLIANEKIKQKVSSAIASLVS